MTVESQSTAPKCSSQRWPCCGGASWKVRRYHSRCSGLTGFITPESADSTGKGTRIWPSKAAGRPPSLGRMAYSHSPFRLTHSGRTIWGRGYSGCVFLGSTCAAQRVSNGPLAGFHSGASSFVVLPLKAAARATIRQGKFMARVSGGEVQRPGARSLELDQTAP